MSHIHYAAMLGITLLSLFLTLLLNTEALGNECTKGSPEAIFAQNNPNAKPLFIFTNEDELLFNQVMEIMRYASGQDFSIEIDKITFYSLGPEQYTYSLASNGCVQLWGQIDPEFFEKLFGIEI